MPARVQFVPRQGWVMSCRLFRCKSLAGLYRTHNGAHHAKAIHNRLHQ